jgi:Lon-like protease
VLGLVPTPYWIVAPGSAIDLSETVAVEGHAPPVDRFFLTDVTVQHANVLLLLAGLVPGFRVVRQEMIVPRGVPPPVYDRRLADAMGESEDTAALVAERAAGLPVADPPQRIVIAAILRSSRAQGVLQVGDDIVSVDGRRVKTLAEVSRAVSASPAGVPVIVEVHRGDALLALHVPRTQLPEGPRLGIALEPRAARANLPVPVRYSIDNVSGSSGGLMFALQIYSALRGDRRHLGTSIAGTGTIAPDGKVGPIEGTVQKLIAAKRAGARIFLVPMQNFREIASEHDVRVVPVGTFREALAALPS